MEFFIKKVITEELNKIKVVDILIKLFILFLTFTATTGIFTVIIHLIFNPSSFSGASFGFLN
jgi:hypothetical protein